MSKIIVAVDESQGSSDAIALASTLAGITGSTLTLVNVFPYEPGPSRASNREFEDVPAPGQPRAARAPARRAR